MNTPSNEAIAREAEIEMRGLVNESFNTTADWHEARMAIILAAIDKAIAPLEAIIPQIPQANTFGGAGDAYRILTSLALAKRKLPQNKHFK